MCGLVGVISKNKWGLNKSHTEVFNNMLWCDAVRGQDSTGIFSVNKWGNVDWIKSKGTPNVLMEEQDYEKITDDAFKNGMVLIGHNRKATHGTNTDENAHPFIDDNIILVHNGMINNHKEHADTEVDSHAIACLIKEKGHIEAIKALDGAFALIWYDLDAKTVYLARNDKRPLNLIHTDSAVYISSEANLAEWLVPRTGYTPDKVTKKELLEAGHCYSFPIDDLGAYKKEKLELFSPKPLLPTIYSPPIGRNTGHNGGSTRKEIDLTIGKNILFEITNYMDTPVHTEWDGLIYGTAIGNPDIQIRAYFQDKDWTNFSTTGTVLGEIQRCFDTPNGTYIWVKPGTLKENLSFTSANGLEVTEELWDSMENHDCPRCNTTLIYWDTDRYYVKRKGNRVTMFCEKCTDKMDTLSARQRRRWTEAANHA